MDCKKANKLINDFLEDKLSGKELREYVKHLKECPECMEETTIQFLATEGLVRLEEGSTFNLDKELQDKLAAAIRKEGFRRKFGWLLFGIEVISVLIIVLVLIYIFLI